MASGHDRTPGVTRRRLLGAAAGGTVLALGMRHPALAAPALVKGSKLTFWGGLIFSKGANDLLVKTINDWGAANGIQTEVVMINQNETVQKVSAAVASNTMPDALDLNLDLLLPLSRQGVFLTLDETFDAIGKATGGWYDAVARATDTTKLAGGRTGVPFGGSGNLILRRKDVLEKAGITKAPATWQELVDQAAAVTKGPFAGLGLALSNVGDGNLQVSVLQSYGARIADEMGAKVMIKSAETRTYLEFIKAAWDRKVFPPGVTTWDGAGDNQAYLAGQVAFIANTGSVAIAARGQDMELYNATAYSPLPGGPKGIVNPINLQVRSISKSSKNPDAARALIEHLAKPEFAAAYYEQAIYGPVLKDQAKFKAFSGADPVLKGLLDLIEKGTAPGYPDTYNTAYADAYNNFIVPKMIQRVVVNNWDFERAMDEAQQQAQSIYDKYK